ncbi:GNAT family N-acetyltransferase [Spirosoma arcticum]
MMTIRRATDADREPLWAIIRPIIAAGDTWAFAPDTPKDEMLAFWLGPGVISYVAELSGEVIGTFFLKNNQPGLGSHVANAGYMVHPAHAGKGIGRQMGLFSLDEARRLGYRAMQFNIVIKTNVRAINLWQSLGFQIIGELPGAFRHATLGFVDACVMFQSLVQPITYRTATVADVDRIAALHARSWQESYRGIMPDEFLDEDVEAERLDVWQERFAEQPFNRQIIVAEDGGQLVGFACVLTGSDPVYGALLDNLHVASAYKGRGIGQALIRQTAKWVQQQDASSPFFLWVYEQNHPARAFYDNLGAINQEAVRGEHGIVLRYVWPDLQTLAGATH